MANGKTELTLQQLYDITELPFCPGCGVDLPIMPDGDRHEPECWTAAAIADARRVETTAERVARAAQDGFVWDPDFPEEPCYAHDLLFDNAGDVIEVQLGARLPSAFGFYDDEGDHWFDTLAEAQAARDESLKAKTEEDGPTPGG